MPQERQGRESGLAGSEREAVLELARAALRALEISRRRLDDLNVYPVPDGDTGTNLTLTVRSLVDSLEASPAADRAALTDAVTRGALLGARGNSGVILSQIVRGAAEALRETATVDAPAVARALRGASNAAYAAVRKPVEGTILTVTRELAEEAERLAADVPALEELLGRLVAKGEEAVARTPELLPLLAEAGVVDAGAAGLVEIVRGLSAALTGEPLPEPPTREELAYEAIHQELSVYRYCTAFLLEGDALDAHALECGLESLGDSLLVVGDARALKIHVHTDNPGAALSAGTALGVIDRVEIADMHRQTAAREERLVEAKACEAVAVAAGAGNVRLFASLGAGAVVAGGQTSNPSAEEILAAIESAAADEVVLLPNNPNVILTAQQAASLTTKAVCVVPTRSLQAGLAAMVAYDPSLCAADNCASMEEALETLVTGEVTRASRDTVLDGITVVRGAYLGLVDERVVASAGSFDEVSRVVVEHLLAEPRDVLTLLVGADAPPLGELTDFVESSHSGVEIDVQRGGQPHYPLLLSAE